MSIPTVKFDDSHFTEAVRKNLRNAISTLVGIDQNYFDQIFDAALRSVLAGGDLGLLNSALITMQIDGMTKRRAQDISRHLNNVATSNMATERQIQLGITEARWMYSGAPCVSSTKNTSTEMDAVHKSANDVKYKIRDGLYLGGKWTWPGMEEGCKCVGVPIIMALER